MEVNKNIPVVRHLDDVDDLLNYGRDGGLIPGQEDKVKTIANTLMSEIRNENKEAVIFVSSPRRRAVETAEQTVNFLKVQEPKLKTRVTTEDDIREIDQGKFILPNDYKPGDHYEGLYLAGKIFFKEVFGADEPGGVDNLTYKYGNPIKNTDGTFKYPQLDQYFESYGESYRDVIVRVYEQVIKASNNIDRFGGKVKIVVLTHGQPSQIFKDLVEIADLIKEGKLNFKTGELPRLCWERYKNRKDKKRNLGNVDLISIENLGESHLIALLKKEVEYLKSL